MKLEHQMKLEEAVMLVTAYIATLLLNYDWWLFFALLFLPDLSMVGYFINNHFGAGLYNFVHNRALAVTLSLAGVAFGLDGIILFAIVLFGHISMDRLLGYGLKYSEGFHSTHLGTIGKRNRKNSTNEN